MLRKIRSLVSNSDYFGIYDNALSKKECEIIINQFEKSEQGPGRLWRNGIIQEVPAYKKCRTLNDTHFDDGSMIGLNDKLLYQYVEWIANKRMKAIGMKPIYDVAARNNPLPWTQHWISSKGLQVAPQETEVESYVVGGIKQDVEKDTFSGFKL